MEDLAKQAKLEPTQQEVLETTRARLATLMGNVLQTSSETAGSHEDVVKKSEAQIRREEYENDKIGQEVRRHLLEDTAGVEWEEDDDSDDESGSH